MLKEALGGKRIKSSAVLKTICLIVMVFLLSTEARAAEVINVERLADAIYKAEGGAKTSHPYGILKKYKTTTPRQACINTINSALKKFANQTKETDFIYFLSLTYCPIGAANDPTGLNKNWVKNVRFFYYQKLAEKNWDNLFEPKPCWNNECKC